MLQITVEDPAHLLDLVDAVDREAEDSAATRERLAAALDDDARERPDADLVRAVDAAVRDGSAPRSVRDLAARVARLDLSWDDVLDVHAPATDPEVAAARDDLVALGLDRLTAFDLVVELEDVDAQP